MDCNRALLLESIRSVHLRAELKDGTLVHLFPFTRRHDPVAGNYEIFGAVTWLFYRDGGALTLRIGDASFVLDDDVAIALDGEGDARRLRVLRGGRELGSFACPPARLPFIASHLAPFAEPEDLDLPLRVRNIAADRGRRERAYSQPESGR